MIVLIIIIIIAIATVLILNLNRIDTGRALRSTRNLPSNSNFTYGKKNIPDKEGAGAVILNWKPSDADSRSERKQRYLKSKAQLNLPSNIKPTSAFGSRSVYAETAKELVNNKFEADWIKSKQKENTVKEAALDKQIEKQKTLNREISNRRDAALEKARQRKKNMVKRTTNLDFGEPPSTENLFKMKRFENVPSKLLTQGPADQICTNTFVMKPKNPPMFDDRDDIISIHTEKTGASQRSASQYSHRSQKHLDATHDFDDISVHSSVSQQPSVHSGF